MSISHKSIVDLPAVRIVHLDGFKAIRKIDGIKSNTKGDDFYTYVVYQQTKKIGAFKVSEFVAHDERAIKQIMHKYLTDRAPLEL